MSTAVVERDTIGEFIALMNTANGREKLYRLLQYGVNPVKENLLMWTQVYDTLKMTRKLMRFFRWLQIWRDIKAALPADMSKFDLECFLNVMSKVFLASYFLFDHAMYAVGTGMWTPPPSIRDRVNRATEGSWVGEIVCTGLYALLKLSQLPSGSASPDFWKFMRMFIRNAVDLPLALSFLNLMPPSIPHGYFGLAGVTSSAISLWEMWPVIAQPTASAAAK